MLLTKKIGKTKIKEDEVVESTFHQLAPYIGKIKPSIARGIIKSFTKPGDTIFDPYAGIGTIPLEAWTLNRNVIANDLNLYAYVITRAKLYPPKTLKIALLRLKRYKKVIEENGDNIDLRQVPIWVRVFFHPDTLREIILWTNLLIQSKEWFILSCLLGILHHQRPGFLSYPSSHTVPYLRKNKFPEELFPQMYAYRSVFDRLEKKVIRSYKVQPNLNYDLKRVCFNKDINKLKSKTLSFDAIITSPPYMRNLDYARDNRLRLWFLGVDWKQLNNRISPTEKEFIKAIKFNLSNWNKYLKPNGKCILILGDNYCKGYKKALPEVIEKIAVDELKEFKFIQKIKSIIPDTKRVRKNYKGNTYETILVLQKK